MKMTDRTPLYERHVALGAQIVEFGGWMMPLQYTSMREEHLAVRERAGIFDVSHMGEFVMEGPSAVSTLERIVTNEVDTLNVGQARYNLVCNDRGGIVDDTLVYRDADEAYTMVVNAGPRPTDLAHFREAAADNCEVIDRTAEMALLAVQGPAALSVLQPVSDIDLSEIAYYHHARGALARIPATFSRTGYTGEDGFELFVKADDAMRAWDVILDAGKEVALRPCGLGARDTLRLEAAMRLSGQDFDESVNPLEAGLGWAVKLDKGDFVGRGALQEIKRQGVRRSFIGLLPDGRAIARHGCAILDGTARVGEVTSGTYSFTLGRAVAMGFVDFASRDSASLAVEIRGERVPAARVPLPFYKRAR
jgi:aminomethyltransferase